MICSRTLLTLCLSAAVIGSAHRSSAQGLQVTYSGQGIETLSYNGALLEDVGANGSDAFHIWHMKMTDLNGNAATCAQCGWGENHQSKNWNGATSTMTYAFVWGSIAVQFAQAGDGLNMNVQVTNNANSGLIFDGATIFPFVLNFPQLPAGFIDASYAQLGYETTGPGVVSADFGSGEVLSVDTTAAKPLYSGFLPAGRNFAYTPLISGTTPDGLATFLPHFDRPVLPGQIDSFTVALRFAASGTPPGSLAQDAYQDWVQTWPSQLNWTDRRAIGTVYLASSPQGDVSEPGGYPNNPRRYFNDSNAQDFDVTTTVGLAAFQRRVLQQAATNVTNLQNLNAQGVVTWDIEGQQYPQSTSYVCSPDQIAQVAPEMESIVSDNTSPYLNMKLDDAYFQIMRSAGFRIGVCVRPQHFTLNGNGTAQQVYLPDSGVEAELLRKMQYAHDRWGATLFYVDSSVEIDGAVLDASIFQQLQAALPDSLIMPEESTPKHYAYTAPFESFINHGATGTDPSVYNYYPKAFSAVLINDVDASALAASQPTLTTSVKNGDMLMTHVDYWQANNPTIVQIYQNAGQPAAPAPPVATPTPTPTPTPAPSSGVAMLSPSLGAVLTGVVQVTGSITVPLDAAGSYLMVDGNEIGTQRESQQPFVYSLDTTTLANGTHTLQLWAHDITNNTDLSIPITVTIANSAAQPVPPVAPVPPITPLTPPATPVASNYPISLDYPVSGQGVNGVIEVTATIPQTLDAAGSYLILDGSEVGTQRIGSAPYIYALDTSNLTAGPHTLQIWAHDTNNDTLLSNPVQIMVSGS